jgi:hypothetical protein
MGGKVKAVIRSNLYSVHNFCTSFVHLFFFLGSFYVYGDVVVFTPYGAYLILAWALRGTLGEDVCLHCHQHPTRATYLLSYYVVFDFGLAVLFQSSIYVTAGV